MFFYKHRGTEIQRCFFINTEARRYRGEFFKVFKDTEKNSYLCCWDAQPLGAWASLSTGIVGDALPEASASDLGRGGSSFQPYKSNNSVPSYLCV